MTTDTCTIDIYGEDIVDRMPAPKSQRNWCTWLLAPTLVLLFFYFNMIGTFLPDEAANIWINLSQRVGKLGGLLRNQTREWNSPV